MNYQPEVIPFDKPVYPPAELILTASGRYQEHPKGLDHHIAQTHQS